MSETSTPDNTDNGTQGEPLATDGGEKSVSVTERLEARIVWLEKEMRKLLHLAEEAPLD